jgi:DNA-binding GntR family transcriptional regulator
MKTLTVAQNIVRYLRSRIITGELSPGQKLIENSLTSLLDVSSAPLREAFLVLENEQLVVKFPRKGCFVAEVSIEDCRQIFKAREALELCAMDLLEAQNIRELPDVASTLTLGSSLPQTPFDDQEKRMREFSPFPEFHTKLVESTGNNWVARLYYSIVPTLSRYQFMSYVGNLPDRAREEHRHILDLIEAGNYEQAGECLRSHIASVEEEIIKVMRSG